MVSCNLLARFEDKMRQAAVENTPFYKRTDGSVRAFGGYNFIFFADWWQLPPIPDSAALFRPPRREDSQGVKDMRNIFWSNKADALNKLWDLTLQNRCKDPWCILIHITSLVCQIKVPFDRPTIQYYNRYLFLSGVVSQSFTYIFTHFGAVLRLCISIVSSSLWEMLVQINIIACTSRFVALYFHFLE